MAAYGRASQESLSSSSRQYLSHSFLAFAVSDTNYIIRLIPGQFPSLKINQHIEQRLDIVSSTSLNLTVSINATKYRIKTIRNILFVCNVLSRQSIFEASTSTEVHHENKRRLRAKANQKIVWGDISINEPIAVQDF